MTARELINTSELAYHYIIRQINVIGCAFDPEEDYDEVANTDDMRKIADAYLESEVQLWTVYNGDRLIIYIN